jgi:hypothetical protein
MNPSDAAQRCTRPLREWQVALGRAGELKMNDLFSLQQAIERDERVTIGDYGIVCTLHRGAPSHERRKKLYSVGKVSTGEHVFTGTRDEAVEKFLKLADLSLPYLAK